MQATSGQRGAARTREGRPGSRGGARPSAAQGKAPSLPRSAERRGEPRAASPRQSPAVGPPPGRSVAPAYSGERALCRLCHMGGVTERLLLARRSRGREAPAAANNTGK